MFYVHLSPLRTTADKRKIFYEKVAAVTFLVVLVGVLVWQAPAVGSLLGGSNGNGSEYAQLNLVEGQYVTYNYDDSSFVFSYGLTPTDDLALFYVVKDAQQTRSYPATVGAVYLDLDLEIKVSAVTSNLVTLLVKPQST